MPFSFRDNQNESVSAGVSGSTVNTPSLYDTRDTRNDRMRSVALLGDGGKFLITNVSPARGVDKG
mgnify:CR=1 FL=1